MSCPTLNFLLRAAPLAAIPVLAGFSPSVPTTGFQKLPGIENAAVIEKAAAIEEFASSSYAPAHLDIKPGSCPNPINVHHHELPLEMFDGVMAEVFPVSILGNKFDVEQINLETVTLTRNGFGLEQAVYPIRMEFGDKGTPFKGTPCDCHDLTGDGELDLNIKFNKAEVIEVFGLDLEPNGTFVELQINGMVKGEIHFSATDCVRIINH